MTHIHKREAEFKSKFKQELKRQLPNFYLLMVATKGVADRVVVGNKRTSFWEFKHATPTFDSPGDQELMCMRLNVAGYCRYVVFWESAAGIGSRTMIVTPKAVHERKSWLLEPEEVTPGFNTRWLVEQVARVHGL